MSPAAQDHAPHEGSQQTPKRAQNSLHDTEVCRFVVVKNKTGLTQSINIDLYRPVIES